MKKEKENQSMYENEMSKKRTEESNYNNKRKSKFSYMKEPDHDLVDNQKHINNRK